MFRINRFVFTAIALILTAATSSHAAPLWIEQLGTSGRDGASGVSTDLLGNVYISGWTTGSLGGPNAGDRDAFLSKYDAAGALLWIEQLATANDGPGWDVFADSLGNAYISGTIRNTESGPFAVHYDVFLAKYDAIGAHQWTEQIGTSRWDDGRGVSADSLGNIYITGNTEGSLDGPNAGKFDAFLAKYNSAGTLQWTEQLGTSSNDYSYGVSTDSLGNVYITGSTGGDLAGPNGGFVEAFLAKYDAAGTLQWIEQLGAGGSDGASSVSVDSLGNVYISGIASDSLGGPQAGGGDAFLAKYDAAGTLLWTEQLGTADWDQSLGVSADSLGNVYISGRTDGNLGGPNAGGEDAFLAKYDYAGTLLWIEQLGTGFEDVSYGVSADSLGNVYISGVTEGSLGGPNAGSLDAFVAKFSADGPTPGDANGDGKVDGLDYVIWAQNYGDDPADDPPGSPGNGDFNDDGLVDGIDYVTWAINYGQGPNDGIAVPEPGSCGLIAIAIVGLVGWRTPRRRRWTPRP